MGSRVGNVKIIAQINDINSVKRTRLKGKEGSSVLYISLKLLCQFLLPCLNVLEILHCSRSLNSVGKRLIARETFRWKELDI